MRAPVAAQVRHCPLLLLKSISWPTATRKLCLLAFDKAMLTERDKNLIDCHARLDIDI